MWGVEAGHTGIYRVERSGLKVAHNWDFLLSGFLSGTFV